MATCNLELDNAYGGGQDYASGVLGIRRHTPGVGTNGYNDGKAQWIPLSNPHVILGTNGFTAPDQGVDFDVLPPGATTWITITIPIAASAKLSDLMPVVIPLPTPSQIIDGAVAAAVTSGTATGPAVDARIVKKTRPGIANQLPLYSYGPSRFFGMGTSSVLQTTRVHRRNGHKIHDNRGVPGFTAGDMARAAFGSQSWPHQGTADNEDNYTTGPCTWTFTEAATGIVQIDPFRNDAGFDGITSSGGTTAKARACAVNGLDAFLRMERGTSATLNTDPSFVYTGTWSVLGPVAGSRSGVLKFTTTPGSSVAVTVADEDLALLALDDVAAGFVGAPFTATLDGAPYNSTLTAAGYPTTTSNQWRKSIADPTNPFGPMMVPSTSGTHTLTLTHNGTAGQYLFVDCKIKRPTAPRQTVVHKVSYLGTAGYASYSTLYGSTTASKATDDIYNGLIDTTNARFGTDGSIKSLDINALGFDPATMISTADNVHYNDAGDKFMEDIVCDAINVLPARSGMTK